MEGKGAADVALLSAELKACRAVAAVARVVLGGNMITGSKQDGSTYGEWQYDNDLSGITALCEALLSLKKPIFLDLSDCGLSVKGVTEIAKAVSAGAAVSSLVISGNFIFGSKVERLREESAAKRLRLLWRKREEIDADFVTCTQ